MPTSSGANKRARADDTESNVAKKKAVFDPKDNAETPKVGGKKMTAAQKRELEAEAKAKATEEALPDCAVPINGHTKCYMHGTSMGTIHLSRNLTDAHAMYIASIRGV